MLGLTRERPRGFSNTMAVDQSIIEKVAAALRTSRASVMPGSLTVEGVRREKDSILTRAAELYAVRPASEKTPPTGFDPAAAALFEALVEGAFIVGNADGEFDDEEKTAFKEVVLAATKQQVSVEQVEALLSDLAELLSEDGEAKRIDAVAKTVTKPEQQEEVLRVAAFIAQISGGVSDVERATMDKLATGFGRPATSVEAAVNAAKSAIG